MRLSRRSLALALVLLVPAAALACLWDSETLQQERARFPSALELITGKFLRHSQEYYEWRIKDRQEKLKSDPQNLGYYDDIAVAYQKIGQHDKSIETILAKEEIQPGLYETYSNLGTFYILAGDFEKGLPHINKALEINPDAHFGREKYQKWLVEYAMSRLKDGKVVFPLQTSSQRHSGHELYAFKDDFSEFVAARLTTAQLSEEQVAAAIKGVLGMMRFADHENPLLLEALADLLMASERSQAARHLASRAFLQASYVVQEPAAKEAYRNLAQNALSTQTPGGFSHDQLPLTDVEADFQKELSDANQWYAELKQRELTWIRDGMNVEAEFDKLYSHEPGALLIRSSQRTLAYLFGAGALITVVIFAIIKMRRRQMEVQLHGFQER